MKTKIELILVDPDPNKTAKKIEAATHVRYAEGWHLRGSVTQKVHADKHDECIHLIFIK